MVRLRDIDILHKFYCIIKKKLRKNDKWKHYWWIIMEINKVFIDKYKVNIEWYLLSIILLLIRYYLMVLKISLNLIHSIFQFLSYKFIEF